MQHRRLIPENLVAGVDFFFSTWRSPAVFLLLLAMAVVSFVLKPLQPTSFCVSLDYSEGETELDVSSFLTISTSLVSKPPLRGASLAHIFALFLLITLIIALILS